MKLLLKSVPLFSLLFFISCEESSFKGPISTFDSAFPKGNRDLSKILGDELTIRGYSDTLTLKISSDKNTNLILDSKNNDTLFYGKVCKFRGLYYFNQQLDNGSYWIYAVKINDNLIYGLRTGFFQMLEVDHAIIKGNNPKMIKFISPDTTLISLHPEKREMKKLFSSIIENVPPDTIMNYEETTLDIIDTTSVLTAIDPEDLYLISKVYPNPTTDIITVDLQQKGITAFELNTVNGKMVLEGSLNELSNKIDISKVSVGVYMLTLIESKTQQKETIKIVKTKQ